MRWNGVLREYKDYLPVTDKTPLITLYEGNTPLIYARNISEELGLKVYLKYEGMNPTGSFKDRGMVVAIAKAVEEGARAVICASTGNTSASASAYSAVTGLKSIVLIPEGAIALGKLAQALTYGAQVIAVKGNFDAALNLVREAGRNYPITIVNSINPYRIEGQKTASFEVCDTLGDAPDYLFIPVGNAGNITAYWKGFKEYKQIGKIQRLPRMMGFQSEGAAPIVRGYPVDNPETIATAIRIGNPASWNSAVQAAKESAGIIDMVSDDEILYAYKFVASMEGVFVEPASAASIAGLLKYTREGKLEKNSVIICVLTGHGLKDPDTAVKIASPPTVISPSIEELCQYL
ncbi:MAG TPA: threonine synthase [bacterium]|nr:threonine synthase [bacterium]